MSLDKEKVQNLLKSTKTLRLLFVEDNADARMQTLKMLNNLFNEIDVAVDGEEGLSMYKKNSYDLVLTDINMPKLNGLEMSKEIYKINPDQFIIILSAYNDTDYLQECINIGITSFLHKPVDLEQIVNTLDKVVHTLISKKKLKQLNTQINNLLNNAKEGYLSFNKDFKCNSGYSQKCLAIFNKKDIEGEDITELLFSESKQNKEIFIKGIKNILESVSELEKELYLSLLPSEQKINNKIIHISYQPLDDDNFMVILKDITKQKELEKELIDQESIKNMLLAIATNKEEFLELIDEFEEFLQNPPSCIDETLRHLHTFKGNFLQQEMIFIVDAIHKCENNIKQTRELTQQDLQLLSDSLQKDLEILKSNFNSDFLKYEKILKVKESDLENIEQKITNLPFVDEKFQQKIEEILFYLNRFRYLPLKNLLMPYQKYLKNLSTKLDKPIYPLEITDDTKTVVPRSFKPFIKSLVHLFNNSLTHGIEDVHTRESLGKDPIGTISCNFQQIQNSILLEVSDNGRGIDTDKLVQKVISNGLKTEQECQNMSEQEKLELIFLDGISTCDSVDMLQGRGVGMSAIYEEMKKLDGKVFITSKKNRGTQFEFLLPMEMECFKSFDEKEIIINSITNQFISLLNSDESSCKLERKRVIDSVDPLKELNHINITFEKETNFDNCILSIPDTLISELKRVFLIDENEEIDKYEIFKETTNIIIGLAISDFPDEYKNITISTPTIFSDEQLQKDIKQSKDFVINEIVTTKGKIYCTILQTKKIKEKVC